MYYYVQENFKQLVYFKLNYKLLINNNNNDNNINKTSFFIIFQEIQ